MGRSGESTYRLTGLEEHSTYLVEVRPSEATEVRTTLLSTAPSGESEETCVGSHFEWNEYSSVF